MIPANALVDIAATTVFGNKFVQLVDPAHPSPQSMHAGQVLDSTHVTVEVNTLFEHLTSVLSKIVVSPPSIRAMSILSLRPIAHPNR